MVYKVTIIQLLSSRYVLIAIKIYLLILINQLVTNIITILFASDFTVDPGVGATQTAGNVGIRFGSLNNFIDLDLILKMEERRGTTNVLQSNRILVLDLNQRFQP